jgi:hypothetical protein
MSNATRTHYREVLAALVAQIEVLVAWQCALVALEDPSTLRTVLEDLTAHRYEHPAAEARAVGQTIAALEAYLAEHAPTSTTHPDRREVEL